MTGGRTQPVAGSGPALDRTLRTVPPIHAAGIAWCGVLRMVGSQSAWVGRARNVSLRALGAVPPAAGSRTGWTSARPEVAWHGGGTRAVEAATGTGQWYEGGEGLAPIRWVYVGDATGTHRDEYLVATSDGLTADAVVSAYCGRWSIETAFQRSRSCARPETTRGRCRNTVTRAAPCLLGTHSAAAL